MRWLQEINQQLMVFFAEKIQAVGPSAKFAAAFGGGRKNPPASASVRQK